MRMRERERMREWVNAKMTQNMVDGMVGSVTGSNVSHQRVWWVDLPSQISCIFYGCHHLCSIDFSPHKHTIGELRIKMTYQTHLA